MKVSGVHIGSRVECLKFKGQGCPGIPHHSPDILGGV